MGRHTRTTPAHGVCVRQWEGRAPARPRRQGMGTSLVVGRPWGDRVAVGSRGLRLINTGCGEARKEEARGGESRKKIVNLNVFYAI